MVVLGLALVVAFALWWTQPAPGPGPDVAASPVPAELVQRVAALEAEGPAPPVVGGATVASDAVDVECELIGDRPIATSVEELDRDTHLALARHQAKWVGETWIRFKPQRPYGVGILKSRTHEDLPFAWANGSCLNLLEPEPSKMGKVVVEVVDRHFHDDPFNLSVCSRARFSSEGPFEFEIKAGTTCRARVSQMVLGTWLYGEEKHDIEVVAGKVTRVVLQAPQAPEVAPGEPGWTVLDGGTYLFVQSVVPDSPAAKAGLRPGDKIVGAERDGEDDVEVPLTEAVEELPVEVVIERQGEEQRMVVFADTPAQPD